MYSSFIPRVTEIAQSKPIFEIDWSSFANVGFPGPTASVVKFWDPNCNNVVPREEPLDWLDIGDQQSYDEQEEDSSPAIVFDLKDAILQEKYVTVNETLLGDHDIQSSQVET